MHNILGIQFIQKRNIIHLLNVVTGIILTLESVELVQLFFWIDMIYIKAFFWRV